MSLEKKLSTKYGEDLKDVDDVEELLLDELGTFKEFTTEDKTFLERFKNLSSLSMNLLGLISLNNLPDIPSIVYVLISII